MFSSTNYTSFRRSNAIVVTTYFSPWHPHFQPKNKVVSIFSFDFSLLPFGPSDRPTNQPVSQLTIFLTPSSRNQTGGRQAADALTKVPSADKQLLCSHDRHLPPTGFRGREIAFSVTQELRGSRRADQICRQIRDDFSPALKQPQKVPH